MTSVGAHRRQRAFPFEIVLSDIDGTLLGADGRVSQRTARTVRSLAQQGVLFAIATGRMPDGLAKVRAQLAVPLWSICYSGALVLDPHGTVISSSEIASPLALGVLEHIARSHPQLEPSLFAGCHWYVGSASGELVGREARIVGAEPREANLQDLVRSGTSVNKLFCSCPDRPDEMDLLARKLRSRFPSLHVVESHRKAMVEVIPGGVNKATGAARLLDACGLSFADAIAFGNDVNDRELLRAAGCGVAVGNADLITRQAADVVTHAAANDGVARYLEGLMGPSEHRKQRADGIPTDFARP